MKLTTKSGYRFLSRYCCCCWFIICELLLQIYKAENSEKDLPKSIPKLFCGNL